MRTSQRGSVLLAIIGGIVILALLGMIAVSLMTGSVMTGVDAKETVQASYLAESGKEIFRAQTAQLTDGAGLMQTAEKLNGSPIPMKQTGDIRLTVYPYWFNTENTKGREHELVLAAAKWYGKSNKVIDGTVDMLLMNANETIRAVYQFKDGTGTANNKESLPSSTHAANAYLIGRCAKLTLSGDTLTATPTALSGAGKEDASAATDSFAFFPPTGGLLGLVEKRPEGTTGNLTTKLASIRFTYTDKKRASDGRYTFSGISPLDGASLTRLGEILQQSGGDGKGKWDVALGQYFRVVSEARTANGARAALVWHTNGRSSFVSKTGGGESTVETLENVSDSLSDGGTKLFGNGGVGKSSAGFFQTPQGTSLSGLLVQALDPMTPYHFLAPTRKFTSTDFWFGRLTQESVYENYPEELPIETSDLLYQATIIPRSSSEEFFSGILFKTKLFFPSDPFDISVSGLGLGIVWRKNTTNTIADPFLLPGYFFNSDIPCSNGYGSFTLAPSRDSSLAGYKTFLVLWAYDDSRVPEGTQIPSGPTTLPDGSSEAFNRPLRWLAIGELTDKDVKPDSATPYCTTLVARVTSEQQGASIQAWIKAKPLDDFSQTAQWPDISQDATQQNPNGNYTDQYRKIKWIAINNAFAAPLNDSNGVTTTIRVKQQFAQDNTKHDRAGIFSGHYLCNGTPSPSELYFTNFAVGVPGSGGGDAITPGLTPGIVQ